MKHLVLIDDDAVCLFEYLFQRRVQVGYGAASVLGVYERGDMLHRAGAVQRDHGCDVGERRRLELLDVAGHAAAFQLEHADRLAARQQIERFGVVQRDVGQVEREAAPRRDQVSRSRQHGQVDQAQKV